MDQLDKNWIIMDKIELFSALAINKQLSYEHHMEEDSFVFHNDTLKLVLVDCVDQVHASIRENGKGIRWERYYPKVDLQMFMQTIRGLIQEMFYDDSDLLDDNVSYLQYRTNAKPSIPQLIANLHNSCEQPIDNGVNTRRRKKRVEEDDGHQQQHQPEHETANDSWWGEPPNQNQDEQPEEQEKENGANSSCWGQPPNPIFKDNSSRQYESEASSQQHQQSTMRMEHQNNNTSKNKWGCPPTANDLANFVDKSVPSRPRRSRELFMLPAVPENCKRMEPPYPAYCTTSDDREFLAFFTKIYGFSNHYPTEFTIHDVLYYCSEQFYMFHKARMFGYFVTAQEIMETRDAKTIKMLGTADTLRDRKTAGVEPNAREFDHDEWRREKTQIMLLALRAKFRQNRFLGHMLVKTGDAYLVEASPSDFFWGIGCSIGSSGIDNTAEWRGDNWMGKLLMRLRSDLQKEFQERINLK